MKGNAWDKVAIVEEELDRIDIDRIENLMDLPRLIFIDEERGNLKVVDNLLEIIANNRNRKSKVLQAYRCPPFDKCYRRAWGKYDFSCGLIFCG